MPTSRSLPVFVLPPVILVALSLTGCAPFPELVAQPDDTGQYPALLPMDELLSQADAP